MLPALVLVLAVGIVQSKPAWLAPKPWCALGWVFGVFVFGTMIFSMFNYFGGREFADASMATPWREIVARAEEKEKAGDEVYIGWRTIEDRFGSDKALFQRYYHGKAKVEYLSSEDWQNQIEAAIKRGSRVWLLLHRDEPRNEIEAWLTRRNYATVQFPFQYDEETLRRLKEGGPRENYRSYLYKLYEVQGEPREPTQ
jgi:hypothetical protein